MIAQLFDGPKGAFVLFDYAISLIAVFSNFLVLGGIVRAKFSLKGYRRFLISLTISDLYICIVNLLFFFLQIALVVIVDDHAVAECALQILRSLQLFGFFANLLNLCGMSADHVMGLLYPLQYQYVSLKFQQYSVSSI